METDIGDDESVSTAVIRAVSAVNGRKPDSLQPLADVVDPDALDTLFDPQSNGVHQADRRLTINYSDCRIMIDNGESLTIEPFETTGRLSDQSDNPDRMERRRSNRDTHQTATKRVPVSRICFVCQRPIKRENLGRERGELVHHKCRAELRCGISLEPWSERSV